jgi:hypothetical protein
MNVRTIVCAQRPRSMSHVRIVESNPQLTASPPSDDLTADTRAVCERSTIEGAFVLTESPSCTFRRFLRSGPATASSGTSSVSGMLVDHSPMSPSQPAVRICFPSRVDATSAMGESCKCNVASGVEVVACVPSSNTRDICAVRSCEAVTTSRSSSEETGSDGTMVKEVTGAACSGAVWRRACARSNTRNVPSYEPVRKWLPYHRQGATRARQVIIMERKPRYGATNRRDPLLVRESRQSRGR